jgi:DNA-directed RNA polymerase specialized sigma24 family protein
MSVGNRRTIVGSQDLFERYLAGPATGDDSDSILESLLADCAPPILNRVVRRRLGSLYTPWDAAELASEAMLELLSRLRALRESGAGSDLPFDALAAGVAANTVYRFFAQRFPEHNRLRKRLRYTIETGSRFRLWTSAEGAAICGLAHISVPGSEGKAERLVDAEAMERCRDLLRQRPVPAHPLASLVFEILRTLARPIDLSRLTALVADLVGIQEPSWVSAQPGSEDVPDSPPDPVPTAAVRLELRQRLDRLWTEILLLPVRHRGALLLSARDANGAALCLMVDLGVATFREVAAALEMTAQELSELWNRLPLEDLEIAARLGLDRQQVINLRATAREKLARRENPGNRGGAAPISKVNRS